MGKYDGILLVSDFDDTLIGHDLAICDRNRTALQTFMEEGGTFCVATGRGYPAFAPQWGTVPTNGPTILSNGACIYDFFTETWLDARLLDEDTPARLTELLAAFPDLAVEVYRNKEVYVHNANRYTQMHKDRTGVQMTPCRPEEMPGGWLKVLLEGDRPYLTQVRDYIVSRWGDRYEVIFSAEYLLELTAKGADKGSAVRTLAARLGIDPNRIYCIGDNQNDLAMLAVSRIPFAPSNCTEEVRASGAVLVCSCDEGAAADVVARL